VHKLRPRQDGMVQKSESSMVYEYYLKDHLGDIRAMVKDTAGTGVVVLQTTDYYPFGMSFVNGCENVMDLMEVK